MGGGVLAGWCSLLKKQGQGSGEQRAERTNVIFCELRLTEVGGGKCGVSHCFRW